MDHTLTDALDAMRACAVEGDPYAALCVVEIERLRDVAEAARAVARREWPTSPSGEVARLKVALRAYDASTDVR